MRQWRITWILIGIFPWVLAAQETGTPTAKTPIVQSPVVLNAPGEPARVYEGGGLSALLFLPDGKTLISAHVPENATEKEKNEIIKLWAIPDGRVVQRWKSLAGITSLLLSSDGKLLIAGCADKKVRLLSVVDGMPTATLEGHLSPVHLLRISSDGKILVSASWDNAINIWALPEGKLLNTLPGSGKEARFKDRLFQKASIYKTVLLAVSPDGRILVESKQDREIRVWSLPDLKRIAVLSGDKKESVTSLAIAADGQTLISAWTDFKMKNATIRLWSLPGGRPLANFKAHAGEVTALLPLADGRSFVSGATGVKTWSLADGHPLGNLSERTVDVAGLSISPDYRILAIGFYDGSIDVWNLEEQRLLATLRGHTGAASLLEFTMDNRYLVTGQTWYVTDLKPSKGGFDVNLTGWDAIAFVWDLKQLSFVRSLGTDNSIPD